jgi:hypothetical protein
VSAFDQRIEIRQPSEQWVDRYMVGDIVTKIPLWRDKERTQPDCIGSKPRDMIKPSGNARKVAHPIAIAVEETPRINLIDYRAAPPVHIGHE